MRQVDELDSKLVRGPMAGVAGWVSRSALSVRDRGWDEQIVGLWDNDVPTAGTVHGMVEALILGDNLLKAYVLAKGDLYRLSIYQRTVPHREGENPPVTHALVLTRSIKGDTGDVTVLVAEARWIVYDGTDAGWSCLLIDAANDQLDRWSAGLTAVAY